MFGTDGEWISLPFFVRLPDLYVYLAFNAVLLESATFTQNLDQ